MEERRKFVRLDASIKISYRVLKKSELPSRVLSRDISGGGIKFPVEEKLKKGAGLDLEIEIPDGQEPIKALGQVVWIKKSTFRRSKGMNYFEIGVKFVEIKPFNRNRISKFVYQRIHRVIYDDLPGVQK
ncbi:MAG: PilZ domain-containing protein [Candidatus Omnitrophota bacterium]|nr:PilZ domain-containing protein [Candidatus Omnitrophota bacterium]